MKKVVIVGGGFAGSLCAKYLENYFDVSLVDSKSYFEFTPSILKAISHKRDLKKIQAKHNSYLKNTKIITSKMIEVSDDFVLLSDKKKLYFDCLVLSSGSSYNTPIKDFVVPTTRASTIKKYSEKICSSERILIIGGGLVGVELAAEIICEHKGKKLILINAGNKLIERNQKRSSEYAENFLLKQGVEIIKGEKIENSKNKLFYTDKGREIKADLTFLCTGITPNSKMLEKNSKEDLSDKKFVKVKKTLQLYSKNNIFVAGDLVDIKEEKSAQSAEKHANIIIKNIIAIEKGKTLKNYSPKKWPMVISLGKRKGILEYGNFIIVGLFPAFMKYLIERKSMLKRS